MKKMLAMIHARNMEFVRDRGTLFWNILFPFFLVFGFAFAFSGQEDAQYMVGYYGEPPADFRFLDSEHLDFISYDSVETPISRLRHHQIDFFINFSDNEYYVSQEAPASRVVEELFRSSRLNGEAQGVPGFEQQTVSGRPIRYVDWLVPGVIGMNMMFSSLFGVGFVLVRYRKNGVLKRLKATPVKPVEFVSAQVISRLIIVMITSVFVFTASNFFLNFLMLGSYITLILITFLSILCLISFGLIFAARIKSEELASGVMNLALWPMIVFSGVFFSLEGTPEIMQRVSYIFPLTHFIQAARAVMLDGAGLLEIAPNLAVLGGETVLFVLIASALFKWE
ncbi:MAG: ABC transporter permease [Spirochaetia bacterium]